MITTFFFVYNLTELVRAWQGGQIFCCSRKVSHGRKLFFQMQIRRGKKSSSLIDLSIWNAHVLITFIYLGVTSQKFLSVCSTAVAPSPFRGTRLLAKEKRSTLQGICNWNHVSYEIQKCLCLLWVFSIILIAFILCIKTPLLYTVLQEAPINSQLKPVIFTKIFLKIIQ